MRVLRRRFVRFALLARGFRLGLTLPLAARSVALRLARRDGIDTSPDDANWGGNDGRCRLDTSAQRQHQQQRRRGPGPYPAQTVKLSPQPQLPFELGLVKTKPAAKSSSTQSISEPIRYISEPPSTNSVPPGVATGSSPNAGAVT